MGRFVGMKFVEKMLARMLWIDQLREFGAQRLNLIVIQHANAGEVAVGVKEINLIFGEAILIPFIGRRRLIEECCYGTLMF